MLIIKKRLKRSHCVRTMHKRIQLLKFTAAMQIFSFSFFFFLKQILDSNWEYIKNKKKGNLKEENQCKTVSESQAALWRGGTIFIIN